LTSRILYRVPRQVALFAAAPDFDRRLRRLAAASVPFLPARWPAPPADDDAAAAADGDDAYYYSAFVLVPSSQVEPQQLSSVKTRNCRRRPSSQVEIRGRTQRSSVGEREARSGVARAPCHYVLSSQRTPAPTPRRRRGRARAPRRW
jgi:hypothetical protein